MNKDSKDNSTQLAEWTVTWFTSDSTIQASASHDLSATLAAAGAKCRSVVASENRPNETSIRNIGNRIITGTTDVILFATAVGLETFLSVCFKTVARERLLNGMSDIKTAVCSELVSKNLGEMGVQPAIEFSQPSNWRDILVGFDCGCPVNNLSITIESTADVHSLAAGLEARGAEVDRIEVFNFPTDPAPTEVQFLADLQTGHSHVVVLSDPIAVARFAELTKSIEVPLRPLIFAVGREAIEIAEDRKVAFDLGIESLEQLTVDDVLNLQSKKNQTTVLLTEQAENMTNPNAPWYDNPFMRACRMEPNDVTPIWMMRQAGRYMSEYREVREKVPFLDLCKNPQLCSEVMCTAVNRLGVDAAIIFSDLLPILEPMGCELEYVKGDGPVIHNPIRTASDVDRIHRLDSVESLGFVFETVRQTRADLPANIPLIGFAGAPFTLASYMIEGSGSKNYAHAKSLMYGDHGAWTKLMEDLSHSISLYLKAQVDAGAQVVQLFDSWAGCLSPEVYRAFVLPHVQKIIDDIAPFAPVINFATGNPSLLPLLAETKAAVVGVDWRISLNKAWELVGHDRAVQGNLDQTVLLTSPEEIRKQAKIVLDQAAGRPGHIFNLGHGILPQTPVDNAIALVDAVHELSQK